jgi:cell division inhibitor SepF
MSGLTQAVRNLRNIWGQGDEDYSPDEIEDDDDVPSRDSSQSRDTSSRDSGSRPYSSSSYSSSSYASPSTPVHGGGSSSPPRARRLHTVPTGLRGREKNIYTIKPKSQDDATIAADCLKAGDAVIVNLQEVDRVNAVRIVDFMSGVCYGLDSRGHAMKLGDAIFLYTPGDFEIRSDEVDYGENEELFFLDENPIPSSAQVAQGPVVRAQVIPTSQIPQQVAQPAHTAPTSSGYINPASPPAPRAPLPGAMPIPDRRAWER